MRSNSYNGISNVTGKCKVFNFYNLKNGSKITCHGRPKKRDIKRLKDEFNVNYIITILHSKEQPEIVQKYVEEISSDITWINLPLQGANMALFMNSQVQNIIINCLLNLYNEMQKRHLIIYIHCAAGVHRTGTVLYTILRMTGETPESAMQAIKQIRLETYNNCGDNRIKYAEEFLVNPLLKKIESINTSNNNYDISNINNIVNKP